MKGIILAGGAGTRLYPLTKNTSKQLLPVYDKPMIYYPMSLLMLAGVQDILIISSPEHIGLYENLFNDGKSLGINISYKVQPEPKGLPQAFTLGEDFIDGDDVVMILGDNIFYSDSFISKHLKPAFASGKPTVFAYRVQDPERYGVVEFDENFNVMSIEEKPNAPKSKYAVTGLYYFDKTCVEKAKSLAPSARGELEIVDLINMYKNENNLKVEVFGRGVAWLDTGTHDSLYQASAFIEAIEKRQGVKIACLEEIAFSKGWISKEQIKAFAEKNSGSTYGQYIMREVLGDDL